MPEPAPLDVDQYLVPIEGASPSGESLRYEDEYAEIERAREEEEDTDSSDPWKKRNPKKADWDAVISLGLKTLKEKSKDIEIAAWVAEALGRRRGLAGLRDGLRLVRSIQDAFWETAHPSFGDLELREGVYEFLDDEKRLPLLIRNAPLVSVSGLPPYSFLKFKESREIKNILKKDPDRASALKEEGKIQPEDFDAAVDATDRAFYVSTAARLEECLDEVAKLNLSIRAPEHYGSQGPTLTRTIAALDEVAKQARQFLARKPAPEPETIEEPEEPEPDWSSEAEREEDNPVAPVSGTSGESSRSQEPARRATPRPRPAVGPISGPEEARELIAEAARLLREADATDPVPYLVVRSLRMGELYRASGPLDPSILRPPSTEDRQSLRRLANEGSWSDLLDQAERILAGPEGTGWLDVRRFALKALSELRLEDAARAARAILGAELRDHPDWPLSELDDGTPCAGSETRAWIEETFPAGDVGESSATSSPTIQRPSFDDEGSSPGGSNGDHSLDPWDQAQDLHRDGRSQEAISLLGRAAREARTGRERFLRTFQQAELCMMMGRPGVATPLLEGLARQIDEFRLDRWEDPGLCARVVAALYHCIRGKDESRARTIYDRLCQLDIGQALKLGEDHKA